MFPASRHAADPALMAVREDNKSVIPEDLWDGILVVAQVIVVGIFEPLVRSLQFDKDQWQPLQTLKLDPQLTTDPVA
jgi:hypothetical protein